MSGSVCITGCSRGLGRALAVEFADRGWKVAGGARSKGCIEELKAELGPGSHLQILDVSVPEQVDSFAIATMERIGCPDLLVNNAGFITGRSMYDMPIEQLHDCLQVMLRSWVDLAHGLLPGMRARGHGRIINVASIYAFFPWMAWDGLYGPIKTFILQWSRKLNLDMAADGVHVTAICPGFTRTELWRRRSKQPSVPKMLWLNPETVAEQALRAVDRGRPVCIPGFLNRCLCRFAPLLPARLLRRYWRAV